MGKFISLKLLCLVLVYLEDTNFQLCQKNKNLNNFNTKKDNYYFLNINKY